MTTTSRSLLLLSLLLFAPAAQALRCGQDLVREGDPEFAVRRACGEPDWVADWHRHGYGGETIWHYNFGPGDLIRILHFRDGRLRRIETGGRGYVERRNAGPCRPPDLETGMSAHELLLRCGEPLQRELLGPRYYRGPIPGFPRPQAGHYFEALVEDWYYDFGGNFLARRLRLVDGIVAEIHTVD